MKKGTKFLLLSLLTFSLCSCGSGSGNKKCGGETCRIGDKRHEAKEPAIPTVEAVFPE